MFLSSMCIRLFQLKWSTFWGCPKKGINMFAWGKRNSHLYSLLISFIYLINYYYIFNKKFRCNDPIFLTKNSWQAARDFVLKWNMLLKQNIYFMKKNLTIWLAHNWPRLLNKHLKWVWTRLERVICSFPYVTSQDLGKNFKSM